MASVLVIDDDPDIASLVSLKLGLDGHSVGIEQDGTTGLARAVRERPDILIVDWTLPGLTGPEICAQVRAEASMEHTWMIMLTARPLGENARAETNADEVLAKPFSPRKLSERVAAALVR